LSEQFFAWSREKIPKIRFVLVYLPENRKSRVPGKQVAFLIEYRHEQIGGLQERLNSVLSKQSG
jgi:hypothetical protein